MKALKGISIRDLLSGSPLGQSIAGLPARGLLILEPWVPVVQMNRTQKRQGIKQADGAQQVTWFVADRIGGFLELESALA